MTKVRKIASVFFAGVAIMSIATSANALTVVTTIAPIYPGTVTGTTSYSADEKLIYNFTIAAPYRYSFTLIGEGGTFPFPIGFKTSGAAGTYTQQYAQLPVRGDVSYSLTTVVPEPSVWVTLLLGFGLVGGSIRRRVSSIAA